MNLKFGDLDNQEEVYSGGVISILLAIGRHLWLSITNIVKALGYTLYLVTWLVYAMFVVLALGRSIQYNTTQHNIIL